jgi:predicted house-cleaning NTP pyrophosphatase (Maf/HAM1 superfamily)
LLSQGLKFDVVVSKFDEDLDKSQFPSAADYAKATATHKALEVANRIEKEEEEGSTPFMIVGSDTVVEAPDGTIMEKPGSDEEAMRMLLSLQGMTHQVHSGVGIVFPDPARPDGKLVKSFAETTRVTFAPLQEAEMRAYIKTGEPFDKAGGYGACFLSRGHSNTRMNTANLFYSHVVGVLLALYENKLLTSRVCLFRAQVSKVQQARLLAPSPGVTST